MSKRARDTELPLTTTSIIRALPVHRSLSSFPHGQVRVAKPYTRLSVLQFAVKSSRGCHKRASVVDSAGWEYPRMATHQQKQGRSLMTAFLKLIGSTENPCPEPYEEPFVDFARHPRQVHPGDHLVLYAAGGRRCVFALATVTGGVYPANFVERWSYRVDVTYEVNMHPALGVPIDQVSTIARNLLRTVRRQSYFRLSEQEYELAVTSLRRAKKVIAASS